MTVTPKFTITLGTFEYLGCPASTFDARERVLEKLREVEGIDIGFGYMLNDDNETTGVRLTVRGEFSTKTAVRVREIGDDQRSAKFSSCIMDASKFEEMLKDFSEYPSPSN